MYATSELLLCYYGDDFTGSTDALEFLTRAGARTMLFVEPPTLERLARYPGLQAVGVAGMTRSMLAPQMEIELEPVLRALRALGAPHVHYKVCSTFDSSPKIGSIGRVIDLAVNIFGARFVPLLVGAPALGRHCVFGNLFARFGGEGKIHRLDRHPSMSKHPVTPADESDLRLHLARQTKKRIGLFDILKLELPRPEAKAALEATLNDGAEIVLFDVLHEAELKLIGALMDEYASREQPLFSVGSSGVEMALGANWAEEGLLYQFDGWKDPGPAHPLFVVSGSCSPVTDGQVDWALEHGFAEIILDVGALVKGEPWGIVGRSAMDAAVAHLQAGRNVILHADKPRTVSRQPDAPEEINRVESAETEAQIAATLGTGKDVKAGGRPRMFGNALGFLAEGIVRRSGVRRMCVAGGDTSGHIAKALRIEALEMLAPLAPGAPLCRAHAPGLPFDGMEIVFKGGQIGNQDFFGAVARGKA